MPHLAAQADSAGVDRIGLDLERRGKASRQAGRGTWLSPHREDMLPAIRARLRRAELFARCDPPHAESAAQVDRLIGAGVRVLMLPMYRTAGEVRQFVDDVAGRARVVLLLETPQALDALSETLAVAGVDELHVGLNDLALALGLRSRFTLLASPLLDTVAAATRAAQVPLGVGGVARVTDGGLPVAPDLVYARLAQLGATRALLARVFTAPQDDLAGAVQAARRRHADWCARGAPAQREALDRLREQAAALTEW